MTAWYYVAGFATLAWIAISIGTGMKFGRFQVHGGWIVTAVGIVFGVLAGLAATSTVIYRFVGAIAHSFTIVQLALFVAVLAAAAFTLAALLPDNLHGFTAGLGLALAWVVLPSLLKQGVVPGQAGQTIAAVLTDLTRPLVQNTRWFG